MITTTTDRRSFQELLPELIDAYSLAPVESHPLADRTNRLTPAFASLSDSLWTALPTTDFSTAMTHKDVAQSVSRCAATLAQKQHDVRQFVESICYHAVELRVRGEHLPDARAAALQSARRPLLEAVTQVTPPLRPALTADLMAQPLTVVHSEVNAWVREACHTIAGQLLLSMHVLVELETVGVIEWPGETTCKLHFFRHVVTQDRIRTRTARQVTEEDDFENQRVQVTELRQTTGRNVYSIERHEHHVMEAEAREINHTQFPIPQRYQEFLQRIPPWIKQYVRILEGDLILERVTQRDLREEAWETTAVQRTAYEIEPAILLGHYVIKGWGQREVDREQFRRDRIAQREPQAEPVKNDTVRRDAGKQFSELAPLAKATFAAAVAVMLFSRLQHVVMVPLAFLLSLAAVGVNGYTFSQQSQWRNGFVDRLFVGSATFGIAATLLALQSALYGVLYGSWTLIGWSLPLGIVAMITWGIASSRQPR